VAMRGAWADAVRSAAALGYDGVELAVRDPERVDREALGVLLRETGLSVPAVGTGQAFLTDGLSLSHPDEGVRVRAIERIDGVMPEKLPPAAPIGKLKTARKKLLKHAPTSEAAPPSEE